MLTSSTETAETPDWYGWQSGLVKREAKMVRLGHAGFGDQGAQKQGDMERDMVF